MKISIKLLLAIFLVVSGCFIYLQNDRINKLKSDLDRTSNNLLQAESDNYSLTFKKGELEKYINYQNTKFKKDIDSVCEKYDIKIKHLQKVINNQTSIVIRDTTYLPAKEVESQNDSLYVLTFSNENNCISARVKAITKDPTTKLNFEELKSQNESFSLVYKEKKKWWQIFRKRKLMMKTVDNCGNSTVKELEVK